jgi:hypothetical protein
MFLLLKRNLCSRHRRNTNNAAVTWIPERNGFRCTEHDQWFRRGACCPHPGCAEAVQEDDAPLSVFADGMLTVADYERKLLAIGDRAFELADVDVNALSVSAAQAEDGRQQATFDAGLNTAAKLLDTAIKAYRGGVECARWREDWKNARLLRDLLARVKRERAELAQERRADESKEARH